MKVVVACFALGRVSFRVFRVKRSEVGVVFTFVVPPCVKGLRIPGNPENNVSEMHRALPKVQNTVLANVAGHSLRS